MGRSVFYTLQDGNGGTPLHYAVRAGSAEAVHAIMSRPKVSKIFYFYCNSVRRKCGDLTQPER